MSPNGGARVEVLAGICGLSVIGVCADWWDMTPGYALT